MLAISSVLLTLGSSIFSMQRKMKENKLFVVHFYYFIESLTHLIRQLKDIIFLSWIETIRIGKNQWVIYVQYVWFYSYTCTYFKQPSNKSNLYILMLPITSVLLTLGSAIFSMQVFQVFKYLFDPATKSVWLTPGKSIFSMQVYKYLFDLATIM